MRNKLGAPCGSFRRMGGSSSRASLREHLPHAVVCSMLGAHVCGFFSRMGGKQYAVRASASICHAVVAPCWVPHHAGLFAAWVGSSTPCEPPRASAHAVVCSMLGAPCMRFFRAMGGKQYARASLPRASAPRSGLLHAVPAWWKQYAVRASASICPRSVCSMQWSARRCQW